MYMLSFSPFKSPVWGLEKQPSTQHQLQVIQHPLPPPRAQKLFRTLFLIVPNFMAACRVAWEEFLGRIC